MGLKRFIWSLQEKKLAVAVFVMGLVLVARKKSDILKKVFA